MNRALLLCLALLVSLPANPAIAQSTPRLGVLVVVDQLSAWNFEERLPGAKGGFRRLVREGHYVRDARFEAAPAMTGTGHATLSTGAYPEVHGVIGNEWYDRLEARRVAVCGDERYTVLGRAPSVREGTAPTRLMAGTLSEALKLRHRGAKVVALAGKDRSSILLAGRSAEAALWIDGGAPRFTTSTFYAKALPAWAVPVNEKLEKAFARGVVWNASEPRLLAMAGERTFVRNVDGFGKSFPHRIPADASPEKRAGMLLLHPLGDEAVTDLALAAVKGERLGADEIPDLLAVSYSGFDKILHAFGPDSPQALEAFRALDANLERLFAGLDAAVGKGRYVVALTADHGGGRVPEVVRSAGIPAGRVDGKGLTMKLELAAQERLGKQELFDGFYNVGHYLRADAPRAKLAAVMPKLRALVREVPGVHDWVPAEEFLRGEHGAIGALYRRGLYPNRSPDFLLLLEPYWLYGEKDLCGHSSAHLYDRSVPVLLMGPGVKRGESHRAEAVDVAPTLAFLMGSDPPANAQGRVIESAVAPRPLR